MDSNEMNRVSQEVALEAVRYDTQTGLVPVVVQDAQSGHVLMQAYANREALKRTLGTGYAWFWSRSRNAYWQKGATSGNVQEVLEIWLDCDGDSVLYRVKAAGPACHTGETSCYFRQIASLSKPGQDSHAEDSAAVGRTDARQTSEGSEQILAGLWQTIEQRFEQRPAGSYTSYLFAQGIDKLAKKVGEEGVEVTIAAKNAETGDAGKAELAAESADLLFHLMALWKGTGIAPNDVWEVLRARHLPG